ncbi:hypothetical protein [Chryseobacterium sp. ON_d1]|uniref:hypothetical protein n=1 Tax=Chryseobacterium sp. ON_d1 TaxID=2583211 RepID=UPI001158C6BC|nr:hypothetical protein [Chryseobacterium sp. ON_d1]GEJ44680.1 hypothetical protein CRS_12880 [Chryseobacterium sp. ON_d1]
MASCFITFKDGATFSRRWTVYDGIIQIVIKELYLLENGKPLAGWLTLQIPLEEEDDDQRAESGYGFYQETTGKWINRSLDTRSLTEENQKLFWKAIENGRKNLHNPELENYSDLSIEYFECFYEMYQFSIQGVPPEEYSHTTISGHCSQKNGPGWE